MIIESVGYAMLRSEYTLDEACGMLGVSRASYYRYVEDSGGAGRQAAPVPKHPYTLLPEEEEAVIKGALEWPELSHRVLSYRLMRESRAYVSSSVVYEILKSHGLERRRKPKREREKRERETPSAPDERWQSDIKYVRVPKKDGGWRNTYMLLFQDEYSRYVVHHELLWSMDGVSVSLAAQSAVDKLKNDSRWSGKIPFIQSDNGSSYVSGEFDKTLKGAGFIHERIRPHCPEENGKVERLNRTLGERIEDYDLESEAHAHEVVEEVIKKYNEEHLHSALNYLTPLDYYRGDPTRLIAERRENIKKAREHRREKNMSKRSEENMEVRSAIPVDKSSFGIAKDRLRITN